MRLSHLAIAFAASVVIGLSGFTLGRLIDAAPTSAAANAPLDHRILCSSDSFSEVDQARDALSALGMRYVGHAQQLMLAPRPTGPSKGIDVSPDPAAPIPEAVAVLEDAASGFRGTGSEICIVRHLLLALRREHLYPRWVSVYLDLVHRQPLEPLVVELASQALEVARAAGRTREVTAALEHVAATPGPLIGREELVRLLSRSSWGPVP